MASNRALAEELSQQQLSVFNEPLQQVMVLLIETRRLSLERPLSSQQMKLLNPLCHTEVSGACQNWSGFFVSLDLERE